MTKIIPKKWKSKKAKWLSEEVLQIAEERREEKKQGRKGKTCPNGGFPGGSDGKRSAWSTGDPG